MCGVSAQYKEVPTPVEKIVHRDHHTIVNREVTREVVVEKFEPYEVWGSPGREDQRGCPPPLGSTTREGVPLLCSFSTHFSPDIVFIAEVRTAPGAGNSRRRGRDIPPPLGPTM